ncbi:hypothetical protein G6K98_32175 [Agrobacterium rhizogenes]|nr:hypothetical protein [Rhizobium rhizogenes]NTH62174.1 hypothetical protein [Rhizobium rhizogenes]NTH93800.1 hypothetical protein [Rhizobium rhizogenes]
MKNPQSPTVSPVLLSANRLVRMANSRQKANGNEVDLYLFAYTAAALVFPRQAVRLAINQFSEKLDFVLRPKQTALIVSSQEHSKSLDVRILESCLPATETRNGRMNGNAIFRAREIPRIDEQYRDDCRHRLHPYRRCADLS